jgi:hypothetical protein
MFHGAFNFPSVLKEEEFQRIESLADDYVRGHVSWLELKHLGVVA